MVKRGQDIAPCRRAHAAVEQAPGVCRAILSRAQMPHMEAGARIALGSKEKLPRGLCAVPRGRRFSGVLKRTLCRASRRAIPQGEGGSRGTRNWGADLKNRYVVNA